MIDRALTLSGCRSHTRSPTLNVMSDLTVRFDCSFFDSLSASCDLTSCHVHDMRSSILLTY